MKNVKMTKNNVNGNVNFNDNSTSTIQTNITNNFTTNVGNRGQTSSNDNEEAGLIVFFTIVALVLLVFGVKYILNLIDLFENYLLVYEVIVGIILLIYIFKKSEKEYQLKNLSISALQYIFVFISTFGLMKLKLPNQADVFFKSIPDTLSAGNFGILYNLIKENFPPTFYIIVLFLLHILNLASPLFISYNTIKNKRIPNLVAWISVVLTTLFILFGNVLISK